MFGGLFGGGGTKVTTKTTVENKIDIDLENIIDTSGFEALLEGFKKFFMDDAANDKQLTEQAQALQLLQTSVDARRNEELDEANQTFKRLAVGVLLLGGYYVFFKRG